MDREIGIAGYGTDSPGLDGRVKGAPEDFVVEEVPAVLPRREDGRHLLVRVTARNWETNRLLRAMARALRISRRRIGFAGTKDKRAVTVQHMTLEGVDPGALARIRLRDVTVEPLHRTPRRLGLGDHWGNRFRVTLRDLAVDRPEAEARLEALAAELEAQGGFPNWFGPQRFGELRPISHRVGRALVHGELAEAVRVYLEETAPEEEEGARRARRAYAESGDVARALREFPKHLGFERALLHHLQGHPDDFAGALQQFPHNLLTLLVNAYQSLLFNRVLSLRLAEGPPLAEPTVGDLLLPADRQGLPRRDAPVEVTEGNREKARAQIRKGKAWVSGPLVGTEVPLAQGPMGRLERRVLEEEAVDPEAFAVPVLPRLASRGVRRELVAPLSEFRFAFEPEGLVLTFVLPPGAYATVLLREVRKPGDTD